MNEPVPEDSDLPQEGGQDLSDLDGPPVWTDEAIVALSNYPAYRKTLELMYLGMKKEAAAELWSLQELMPKRYGAVIGLSKAFFELGDYYSSLIIVLRNFDRQLERPSAAAARGPLAPRLSAGILAEHRFRGATLRT